MQKSKLLRQLTDKIQKLSKTKHYPSASLRASTLNTIRYVRGFTLIELLVAISVLGVMAAAGLTIINPAAQIQKANDARRKTDLAQIQRALEQFYQDNNGNYPINPTTSDYRIVDLDGVVVDWGANWRYMKPLPADPKSSKRYVYVSSGQSYRLYASLDRAGKDPQACNTAGTKCQGAPNNAYCCKNGLSTCGYCNYGVSSPNVSP